MTQLGEAVAVGIVDVKDLECPFHEDKHVCDGATNNYLAGDATELGKRLAAGGAASSTVMRDVKPDKDYRSPRKAPDPDEEFSEEEREVQIVKGNDDCKYPVAYSAHHLIPAKESLKRASALHKFIDKRKGSICCNLGYDVDGNENGVWLPGLHAVNSKGLDLWGAANEDLPDEDAVGSRVRSRAELEDRKTKYTYALLDGPKPAAGAVAFESTNMKWMYVRGAMTFRGLPPRQFHDRHVDYSNKVKDHLIDVAGVLSRFIGDGESEPGCSECKKAKDKPPPPVGLLGLLNLSSRWFQTRLVGRTRDNEYYTSSWCSPLAPAFKLPRRPNKAKKRRN